MSRLARVRKPIKADYDVIGQSLRLAYGRDWSEDEIEVRIDNEVGHQRTDGIVYGVAHYYEIPHDIYGVIPAGWSTQIKDLVPQHHEQRHIDGPISRVVAECCRDVAADTPEALEHPIWAFLAYDLAVPYWINSPAKVEVVRSRGGDRSIVYVDTLRETIERLEAAGL